MINTRRYDLNDRALIESCVQQMTTQGVCILPDFLTAEAIEILRQQSDSFCFTCHSVSRASR
jgi:hypothetical protein